MTLFRVLSAPSTWRDTDGFPEGRGKMALVGEAALERDVTDAYTGIGQTTFGRFDALCDQILVRR